MPIVSSRYWNIVHGATPEEVKQDLEGIQTMRILGKNMAYFIKCKDLAAKMGRPGVGTRYAYEFHPTPALRMTRQAKTYE